MPICSAIVLNLPCCRDLGRCVQQHDQLSVPSHPSVLCKLSPGCLNAGLAEAMAPQLTKFNISMSLVEPGPVSTPFIENIHKNAGAAENSAPKEPSDPYA